MSPIQLLIIGFMSTFSARKPRAQSVKLDFTAESRIRTEFFREKWIVEAGFRRNRRIALSEINGHGAGYPCSYRIYGSWGFLLLLLFNFILRDNPFFYIFR